MAGEARLEIRALPIAHRIGIERLVGHRKSACGRPRRGLAELQMDDRSTLRFE